MKRKYKKSGKYAKHSQEAVQSNSTPLKEESSISLSGGIPEGMVLPESVTTTTVKGNEYKVFTFENLPLSIKVQVERTLAYRKRLKLPDDSVERKQRAIDYFTGSKAR